MKMKRKFSKREKVMLAFLALLLIGCFYYYFVDQPVRTSEESAAQRKANVETELTIQSVRLSQMRKMEDELAEIAGTVEGNVPNFDNANNVVKLLNSALSKTADYSLSFQPLELEDAIVRRTIIMNFTCANYQEARQTLDVLCGGPYRCEVDSLTMTAPNTSVRVGPVTVNATVTFFEFSEKTSPDVQAR